MNTELDELKAELKALESFHPRAMKLMRKRKHFIVVACDEPYFMDVYSLIADEETKKGTWTPEDEAKWKEWSKIKHEQAKTD